MYADLKEGILCLEVEGKILIFDTGSPVTLGDGTIIEMDGVSVQTQTSFLNYNWRSIQATLPFEASALIGTDQIAEHAIYINLDANKVTWEPRLTSGQPMEMLMGVPVVTATLNKITGRFFLDTGASICYVLEEALLADCQSIGRFDDFHPMLGAFSTKLFTTQVLLDQTPSTVEVGLLPDTFSSLIKPFGINGILGINCIKSRAIEIDFKSNLFRFPKTDTQTPHDSWAEIYDDLFNASFGGLLSEITELTVGMICELSKPTQHILDIGAGTGRLTAPLLEKNFYVSALDPSAQMLQTLEAKIGETPYLKLLNQPISELALTNVFDGAVCLFTVSSYWLDEESFKASLAAIYRSLLPNGWLLIDRTMQSSFADTIINTEDINRNATVEHQGNNIYRFTEDSLVQKNGDTIKALDSFLIRFWKEDLFLKYAKDTGFILEEDLTESFSGSGASLYLLRKR